MATTELEYLRLPKYRRVGHKLANFFKAIPGYLVTFIFAIGRFFRNAGIGIANVFRDIFLTFKNGDWKTRTSYVIMGFGNIARGQILRGVLFLLFEVAFIVYMACIGGYYLYYLDTLGTEVTHSEGGVIVYGHDSFKILLYGVMSIFFIIAFIYTWYVNVKQNKISQEILATGKPLKSGKQDLQSLVDDQFHKTLLALPLLGILIFTVLPLFFMILISLTNYDGQHLAPNNLFTWVGFENFGEVFNIGGSNFSSTFGEILLWTLIWAFFATFTNYFLGMVVAMIINKKGIKLKKFWRTVLVVSIAIPQFISLLYVGKMFARNGFVNMMLMDVMHVISEPLPFWEDVAWARITIILVNIWVGIPYLMLITTGILMNIPADLYESARIDGASPWKMYFKITLPYMLFVTGPYLLSSFIGNMNNFNVIYLLSGGEPIDIMLEGSAGHTDLLITWLYKLTVNDNNYKMASVIGIMVFIVVSVISVVVYNIIPSMKNEEDFQ